MDPRLQSLITDYQAAVVLAVQLLGQAGIPRPVSNAAWTGYDMPQRGTLSDGATYFKHGYGCAVRTRDVVVDFDFGDHGQIDGFDLWRLSEFCAQNHRCYGFSNDAELEQSFQAAVEALEIVPSDYILHYLSPLAAG